jgi:hypothetical protein
MTREQRKAHALLWTLLGPAILLALISVILLRPEPPTPNRVPGPDGARSEGGRP